MAPSRTNDRSTATKGTTRTGETHSNPERLEQQVVAFAEQLGWMVGIVKAKADGWMDRDALASHLSNIRDGAADLLEHMAGTVTPPSDARRPTRPPADRAASRARSGVDAPGKKHRKPLPPQTEVARAKRTSASSGKAATMRAMQRRRRG